MKWMRSSRCGAYEKREPTKPSAHESRLPPMLKLPPASSDTQSRMPTARCGTTTLGTMTPPMLPPTSTCPSVSRAGAPYCAARNIGA